MSLCFSRLDWDDPSLFQSEAKGSLANCVLLLFEARRVPTADDSIACHKEGESRDAGSAAP